MTNVRFKLLGVNATSIYASDIEPATFSFNVARNGIPSLSFTYPRQGYYSNFLLGNKFPGYQIAMEFLDITTNTWVEPRNCRFVPIRRRLSFGSGTHVEVDCVGWTWLLKKAFVDSAAAQLAKTQDITWTNVTAGSLISSNVSFAGLTVSSDTTSGAGLITKTYSRTTTIMEVIEELTSEGYIDWWGSGATLALARAGYGYTDKSSTITFEIGRDLLSYDVEFDLSTYVNYALVTGPPGVQGVVTQPVDSAIYQQGLWYQDRSSDDRYYTTALCNTAAQALLNNGTDQRVAIFGNSTWRPFLDFEPGTRVQAPAHGWTTTDFNIDGSPTQPVFEPVVVDTIAGSLKEAGGEIEISLTFNSTASDDQLLLIRRATRQRGALNPQRVATLESYTPGILEARPQLRVYNAGPVVNGQVIPYNSVRKDSHGKWNATSKTYTVPAAGLWSVQIQYKASAAASSPALHFQVDGVGQLYSSALPPGAYNGGHLSGVLDLPKGAVCRVVENNATYTPQNDSAGLYGTGSNYLHMTYLGPST